jgi:MSHA biogenesis protein MshJ
MKQRWQQLAARIDGLSLRERVFLFLVVIVCVLALADAVWLSPAQMAYRQATQRVAGQGLELKRLRDELQGMAQLVDPTKAVRDEIAEIDLRLEAVNADIHAVAPQAEGGPAIEQALVQFLRRQEGLTLLNTGTAKRDMPVAAATGGASALSRRALELSVSGSYAELVRYIQTLETALPTLRWGTLHLNATKQPPELELQVYVVGVAP